MRRLAICQEAPPRCLKKPIDGFLDSPYRSYIDIAKISKRVPHAWGPRRTVASGAPRSPRENHLLLFTGLSSAGILIGAPNLSKELSLLQEASYTVTKKIRYGDSTIGAQKVFAGAALILTGAFMVLARISRDESLS